MACVVGVSEGEGPWPSPRTVDDAASGQPRSRAWTDGRACVLGQPGAGHGVQDPRPGRGETAQSAILHGAARSRLCRKGQPSSSSRSITIEMLHEHEVLPWRGLQFMVPSSNGRYVAPSGWTSPISVVLLIESENGVMRQSGTESIAITKV